MVDSINSNRTYTAIRNDLYRNHADKKDGIRFADGKRLYVKKGVTNWFGNKTVRAGKYAKAVDKLRAAINTEFIGTTVNGRMIGDAVLTKMGNPAKLTIRDLKTVDDLIAKTLREVAGRRTNVTPQAKMQRHAAQMFDRALGGKSNAKNLDLTGWSTTVAGRFKLHQSLAQDLKAADPALTDTQAATKADQLLKNAGVPDHAGLSPVNLARVVAHCRTAEPNLRLPHVTGLPHIFDARRKTAHSGRQMLNTCRKIGARGGTLRHNRFCNIKPRTLRAHAFDTKRLVRDVTAQVRTSCIQGGAENTRLHRALILNVRNTADLCNHLPLSRDHAMAVAGHQGRFADLPAQEQIDIDDAIALRNALQTQVHAAHDLALMFQPVQRGGIASRPAVLPPGALLAPSALHSPSLDDGLDTHVRAPITVYLHSDNAKLVQERSRMEHVVKRHNTNKDEVRSLLADFREDASDATLGKLSQALNTASRSADQLLSKYQLAKRIHHGDGSDANTRDDLDAQVSTLQSQRAHFQVLKTMVTHVNQQRNLPTTHFVTLHPKDEIARKERQSQAARQRMMGGGSEDSASALSSDDSLLGPQHETPDPNAVPDVGSQKMAVAESEFNFFGRKDAQLKSADPVPFDSSQKIAYPESDFDFHGRKVPLQNASRLAEITSQSDDVDLEPLQAQHPYIVENDLALPDVPGSDRPEAFNVVMDDAQTQSLATQMRSLADASKSGAHADCSEVLDQLQSFVSSGKGDLNALSIAIAKLKLRDQMAARISSETPLQPILVALENTVDSLFPPSET